MKRLILTLVFAVFGGVAHAVVNSWQGSITGYAPDYGTVTLNGSITLLGWNADGSAQLQIYIDSTLQNEYFITVGAARVSNGQIFSLSIGNYQLGGVVGGLRETLQQSGTPPIFAIYRPKWGKLELPANDTQPVHYKIYDPNGKVVAEQNVLPGASVEMSIQTTDPGRYSVWGEVVGKTWNPGTASWESTPGTNSSFASWSFNGSALGDTQAGAIPTTGTSAVPSAAGTTTVTRVGSTTVLGATVTGNLTDSASNGTMKSVGDQIAGQIASSVDALRQDIRNGGGTLGGTSGGSGSGSSVDLGPTNTRLDTIANLIHPDGTGDHTNPAGDLSTANDRAAAAAPYSGVSVSPAGTANVTGIGGNVSAFWSGTVGNQTVSLDPSTFIGRDILVWGRSLILIGLCVGFVATAGQSLSVYLAALPLNQGQDSNVGPENLVPGVSQAKTWGAAGAAVVAIMAAAAAMVAIVDTFAARFGFSITAILQAWNMDQAAAGLGMVDAIFPVGPALQLVALRAAVPYVIAPMYLAAAGTLRFIKA